MLRAPIFFYRIGLGWVFGRRSVLLTHIGRVSGEPLVRLRPKTAA